MTESLILDSWASHFPLSPPQGFLLRQKEHYLVRFHSMPGTRRIPETVTELRDVLSRLTQIADSVFLPGEAVSVVLTEYSHDEKVRPAAWHVVGLGTTPRSWLDQLEPYVDVSEVAFSLGSTEWYTGCAEAFFSAISQDKTGSVVIFSLLRGVALCPYDGGVDVILQSEAELRTLKERFQEWLPERTSMNAPRDGPRG